MLMYDLHSEWLIMTSYPQIAHRHQPIGMPDYRQPPPPLHGWTFAGMEPSGCTIQASHVIDSPTQSSSTNLAYKLWHKTYRSIQWHCNDPTDPKHVTIASSPSAFFAQLSFQSPASYTIPPLRLARLSYCSIISRLPLIHGSKARYVPC